MRAYHRDGTLPSNNAVFVFGSNLAGVHGAGAARAAMDAFNAECGVGIGPTGSAYAIPTKDRHIKTMPLAEIEPHVTHFLQYARSNRETTFFVTRIGCGLAGYRDIDIAPMFRDAPENCDMPDTWREWVR